MKEELDLVSHKRAFIKWDDTITDLMQDFCIHEGVGAAADEAAA